MDIFRKFQISRKWNCAITFYTKAIRGTIEYFQFTEAWFLILSLRLKPIFSLKQPKIDRWICSQISLSYFNDQMSIIYMWFFSVKWVRQPWSFSFSDPFTFTIRPKITNASEIQYQLIVNMKRNHNVKLWNDILLTEMLKQKIAYMLLVISFFGLTYSGKVIFFRLLFCKPVGSFLMDSRIIYFLTSKKSWKEINFSRKSHIFLIKNSWY